MQPKLWNTLLCLSLLWLLAGCVPSPELRPDQHEPANDPLVKQAESFAANGDFVAAAGLFERIAADKLFAEKQRSLLRAAESHFLAADPDSASALRPYDVVSLPFLDFQRRLLTAEMAVSTQSPG